MALDLSKIKSRLNSLSNTNQNKNLFWKPKPGKQVVRIVPYKFAPENPFMELKFHYGIKEKTYLSPDTFGRPDPIVEFSNRLKKTGDKEDWKMGKKMEPKMRTYVPVIVRGEESEGVKFWGFGKQVYENILSIIDDPDFGDITDLTKGRDIVVEFKEAAETGKSFPETSVRAKPNATPAVDPANKELVALLAKQTNILELYEEKSYEELKNIMNAWLNPENEDASLTTSNGVTSINESVDTKETSKPSSITKTSISTSDIEAQFDNLFNS
jgi:hypothetical protein